MLSHGFKKLSASHLPWRVVARNVRPNEGCGLILVDFRYFCASCNLYDGCILGLALTGPLQTTEIDADRHACFFSRFVIFF